MNTQAIGITGISNPCSLYGFMRPCLALPLPNKIVCIPIYFTVGEYSNLIVFIPWVSFLFYSIIIIIIIFSFSLMFTPFTLIGVLKQKRNVKIERDIPSIRGKYTSLRK